MCRHWVHWFLAHNRCGTWLLLSGTLLHLNSSSFTNIVFRDSGQCFRARDGQKFVFWHVPIRFNFFVNAWGREDMKVVGDLPVGQLGECASLRTWMCERHRAASVCGADYCRSTSPKVGFKSAAVPCTCMVMIWQAQLNSPQTTATSILHTEYHKSKDHVWNAKA
jgi:hypothetical protein